MRACGLPSVGEMARIRRLGSNGRRVVWVVEDSGIMVEAAPGAYVGRVTEVRCLATSAIVLVRVEGLGEVEAVAGVIRG